MALDTMDKLVAMLASSYKHPVYKASVANTVAGQLATTWQAAGMPGPGATPAGTSTCTNALAGSFSLPDITALKGYIGKLGVIGSIANTWILFDRLAHVGGLSGTVITPTAQTCNVDLVTAAAAGRCASDGSDVDWSVDIHTALGATGVNLTTNYNNQADAAVNAAVIALGATPRAARCYPIIPNAGTTIKKLNTVTLSATTGTAGNFGVTARKRLCSLGQLLANVAPSGDFAAIGLPEFKATSCLELVVVCSTTSTGILMGEVVLGAA